MNQDDRLQFDMNDVSIEKFEPESQLSLSGSDNDNDTQSTKTKDYQKEEEKLGQEEKIGQEQKEQSEEKEEKAENQVQEERKEIINELQQEIEQNQQDVELGKQKTTFETFLNKSAKGQEEINLQCIKQQFNQIEIKKVNEYSDEALKVYIIIEGIFFKQVALEAGDYIKLPNWVQPASKGLTITGLLILLLGVLDILFSKQSWFLLLIFLVGTMCLIIGLYLFSKIQSFNQTKSNSEKLEIIDTLPKL